MVYLRSGNLKIEEGGVNCGRGDGNLRVVNIPDLNLNDDPNVVSSEEGGGECTEVSKTEGMSNSSLCEETVPGGGECKSMKGEIDERAKSLIKNGNELSKICSSEIDHISRILGQDSDVSGEGKDVVMEKLNGALDLANGGPLLLKSEVIHEGLDVAKSQENGGSAMVCQDEEEIGLGVDAAIGESFPCRKGIDTSDTGDKLEYGKDNIEGKRAPKDCDSDLDRTLKSDSGVAKGSRKRRSVINSSESKYDEADKGGRFKEEAKEGRTQVFGKVLRSRVVPANGLAEEAGWRRIKASPNKRKKEADGLVEDPKRLCSRGKPKKALDLSNRALVKLKNVNHESKTEHVNDASLNSSEKRGKRAKPKNSTDNLVDQISKVEDISDISTLNTTKEIHEDQISIHCSAEDAEVVCKGEDRVEKVRNKSVGDSTPRRKSERSKRIVDYCEKERRKLPGCKMDNAAENENVGLSNVKVPSSKVKGKLGRPRKQVESGQIKMLSYDNDASDDRKRKPSLITPSKGVGTSSTVNPSVNPKRGETPGSCAAEKNLIRSQIVKMVLQSGWTIEHRPRNGRDYHDAVYVNREGKTFWSITKAYFSLQQEFEEVNKTGSKADKSTISFTPLPEEVLSKLFRVVSKTRSDKNKKKKNKGDGDVSDDEVIRDKHASKTVEKKKNSCLKRKPSAQGGTQSKRRCALVARKTKRLNSERVEAIACAGKHSILAWLIDSGVLNLDGKVQYMNRRKTRTMLEGKINRDGISCDCCQEIISVSEFEKHAGSKLAQSYENLYLEGGKSLLKCLLDSWNKQDEASLKGLHSVNIDVDDPNDDTCAICGDGGDLMCCDGCPSTFHHDCLTLEDVPSGEWHCVFCSCKFCGEATQMIDYLDTAPTPLITCCLCDEKYHDSCADEENIVHTKGGRENFCCKNCEQIFEQLQALVGTKSDLEDGFSWTLLQRFDVTGEADSLKARKIENNSKLAVALAVMDECFVPIIDPRSGVNLIRHVVYNSGSNFRRLNFPSFFTIILEKGDEVISAASIRIHGKRLAEMPFIGTRNAYRRQGMCRRLFTAIELALSSLGIENLVIPAISELLNTWTSVFGFQPLDESIREEMRLMSLLVFAHTDMLQKPLLKNNLVKKRISTIENAGKCSKSSNEQLNGKGEKSEVDDGCCNGSFDLNVVAPGIPESSTNKILDDFNAENCWDNAKSELNSVNLDDSDKVESLATPMETSDIEVPNSAPVVNASEACTIPDHSSGPTILNMAPTLENEHEQTETVLLEKDPKQLTLNPDFTNTSDALESGTVLLGVNHGNACVEEKLRPKSEIHDASIPILDSATEVSSNGSLLTAVESTENFDTHVVVCPTVTRVPSESLCNMSAAVGETATTGLFPGSIAPKVGSN